jgi:hypothetical protein
MICDYCSKNFTDDSVKATLPLSVNYNNKIYKYEIIICVECWGSLMGKPRDDEGRVIIDGQVELYKIKKYKMPQGKRKKDKLFYEALKVPVSSIKGKDKF